MPESDEKAHSETVAIAENVLCEAFKGDVRLKMETEFDTDQATVLRCHVLESPSGVPQSVIVKKILTADGTEFPPKSPDEMVPRFFNDWAGLEFLSKISNGDSPTAQFYGGNREKRTYGYRGFRRWEEFLRESPRRICYSCNGRINQIGEGTRKDAQPDDSQEGSVR